MDVRRSFPLQKASTLRTVCLNLAALFFFFFFFCQCAFFRTIFHAHKIKGCDLHSGFRVSLQTGISRSDREKIHGVLVASLSARQIQRLCCVVLCSETETVWAAVWCYTPVIHMLLELLGLLVWFMKNKFWHFKAGLFKLSLCCWCNCFDRWETRSISSFNIIYLFRHSTLKYN